VRPRAISCAYTFSHGSAGTLVCIYPAIHLQTLAMYPHPGGPSAIIMGSQLSDGPMLLFFSAFKPPSPRSQLTQPRPSLHLSWTGKHVVAVAPSISAVRTYVMVAGTGRWLQCCLGSQRPCSHCYPVLVAGATCFRLDGHLPGVGVEILAFHQGNASFALTARDLHGPALPSCTLTLHFGLQDAFLRETLSSKDVPR